MDNKCIFCKDRGLDTLKVFETQEKIEKCIKNLEIRKEKGWKYSDVKLPTSVNDNFMYHSKCFHDFNTITKKRRSGSKIT